MRWCRNWTKPRAKLSIFAGESSIDSYLKTNSDLHLTYWHSDSVSYEPQFIVTPALVRWLEQIAALREQIFGRHGGSVHGFRR